MEIVKIAVLGIVGVLLAIPLKKEKGEYSIFIAAVVCICIFFYLLNKVEYVLNVIAQYQGMCPIDSSYMEMLVKMVGISYVAEFAIGICKDAGYTAVGTQIEIYAKISIVLVSVPIFEALLEMIGSYL